MTSFLRFLYFNLIVTPFVWIVIGLNLRGRENLPTKGPAIIAANHNSHLDTMIIMVLLKQLLPIVKPVAAADYFLKNKRIAWFALNIIGIVPIYRDAGKAALDPVKEELKAGKIVIIFPEGSRGEPEKIQEIKKGVAHLAKDFPDVPIVPIGMFGLGKALPKGEALFVPFFCDVYVDNTIFGSSDTEKTTELLQESFERFQQSPKG